MKEVSRRYECILVDVVNLCYKLFKKKEDLTIQVGSKMVYRDSICEFIRFLEKFSSTYLHSGGNIFLLFDNYHSRADLKTAFAFADRKELDSAYKESRKKENKEFYNSINFLKYFYITGPSNIYTLQITGLEADDLVKPLLNSIYCKEKSCLLLTSDLDWCRYLNPNPRVDWLPCLGKEPETFEDLAEKLGFQPTEINIVAYKSVFGDKIDNIENIASDSDKHKQEFIELIEDLKDPEDLIYKSRVPELKSKYDILKAISDNERRFYINMQLVSTIQCDTSYLDSNLVKGEGAGTLHKTIREAIGLDEEVQKFTFGNIKRPRAQVL